MQFIKRSFVAFLALITLLGMVPFGSKTVRAAAEETEAEPYFEDIQYAMFPMNYLNIIRTNTKLDADQEFSRNSSTSGHRAYSFDLNGGNKKVEAPFDLKIVDIYQGSHLVVVESLRPVRFANGTVDYMTCVLIHDNDIKDLKEGQTYKQGQVFYHQGDYGDAEGVHLHLETAVGRGYCTSSNYYTNLKKIRANGIQVHEALFLTPAVANGKGKQDITVSKEGKARIYLDWQICQQITFHGNVSGVADLTRYYPVSQPFGSLPVPVNSGMLFDGWYTAKTGGTKVDAQTVVTQKHTDLYARWKELPADLNKMIGGKKVTIKATNITQNDAKLSVSVGVSGVYDYLPFEVGFYIGTDAKYLTRCEKTVSANGNKLKKGLTFQPAENGFALRPDTTYYYQFYVTNAAGNGEIRSEVASFKTQKDTTKKPARIHVEWRKQTAAASTSSVTVSASVNFRNIYSSSLSSKVDYVGFYLGETKNKLIKTDATTAVNAKKKNLSISFDLGKQAIPLKPNTTYYYKLYVVSDGVEYPSGVRSFKTKGSVPAGCQNTSQTATLSPSWSGYSAGSITQTNAKIGATVKFGKKITSGTGGFYVGTTKSNLAKSKKTQTIRNAASGKLSFDLKQSGHTLKAGTTYYYQFYLIVDGKEYKSAVKSFTTTKATATTTLNPTWSKYSASDITQTNATIAATVNYGKKLKADSCGFYLGTAQNDLTKAKKYDTISESRNYTSMWYDLNKYGYTLKAGTTYYYQFYVVVEGKEYRSAVKSFTSAPKPPELSPVWSDFKVSKVSKTNATIACKVTYGKTVTPECCGFYLGTSKDDLVKADKFDTINAKRTYSGMSYGMNKYGFTLKAGTTYYYCFYVIVNGVEYVSEIRSFKTTK